MTAVRLLETTDSNAIFSGSASVAPVEQLQPSQQVVTGLGTALADAPLPTDEAPAAMCFVPPPRLVQDTGSFKLIQSWQGRVDEVTKAGIVATIYDLSHPANGAEQVMLPHEEIGEAERRFVTPGAVFYWSIGYATNRYGTQSRTSSIQFRRLIASQRPRALFDTGDKLADLFETNSDHAASPRSI